ncbi:subtilisin-like protease [Pluteus cervinus]|uniref:Subtilisin-like protease n=1 Tax=Pluteus cervinus TaxID=181527 RepID=A0ACD3ANV3_9AGAR|nr:subtilisin-like protease [Pluteus cervinus]
MTMKLSASWLLLLAAWSVLATVPLSSVKRETNSQTVPNRFIVEFSNSSPLVKRSPDERPHDVLYSSLSARGIKFKVDKEYDQKDLFVGAALTLNNTQDVTTLQSLPEVVAIRPVRKIDPPKPINKQVLTDPTDPAVPPNALAPHILTGVDKVHAEGNIGTGVRIAIIDTGIDWKHPTLGAGFGPLNKIIGGFDLVGDAYDGSNTPEPDPDPLDECNGHGTHVAGIIGADPTANPYNITGVAYGASLSSYRVFGCAGYVTDDVLIQALLLAVTDGHDIITLSIGGADGWTETSSAVIASRIADTGIVVTIAAGNDGSSGSWYTSSPGNGLDVISAASLDNTVIRLQTAVIQGVDHDPIAYFAFAPLPIDGSLPIYVTSNDTTVLDDACNPLPPAIPDLSKFLVIIRRGTCTFVQKIANIQARGAKSALIYDNGSSFSAITVGDFNAALIQAEDGAWLVSQFLAGAPITLSFPQTGGEANIPDPAGGLISSFTSYGPSNDFHFKPALAAPGGNILSTLPLTLGSYGIESGTSMATPFIAGSAALLLAAKGKSADVAKNARTLFQSTAQPVPATHEDGALLQTLTQQGAGLIDVYRAIHTTTTTVSPTELLLNDTAHFANPQKFIIKNTGNTAQSYKLSHIPAGTALTVEAGTILPVSGPVPITNDFIGIDIFPPTFLLRAGASQEVTATFSFPDWVDPSSYPVYSGFIEITGQKDILQVSYLGLGAALKDKQVLDNTADFFGVTLPAILDSEGNVQLDTANYTFKGLDYPTLLFRLVFGTPAFRADLVKVSTDPQPKSLSARDKEPVFSPQLVSEIPAPAPFDSGDSLVGPVVTIVGTLAESFFIPRHNTDDNGYSTISFETNTFSNGTRIPNGNYRLLVRACRVSLDPSKAESYDSWYSPLIGVKWSK